MDKWDNQGGKQIATMVYYYSMTIVVCVVIAIIIGVISFIMSLI